MVHIVGKLIKFSFTEQKIIAASFLPRSWEKLKKIKIFSWWNQVVVATNTNILSDNFAYYLTKKIKNKFDQPIFNIFVSKYDD